MPPCTNEFAIIARLLGLSTVDLFELLGVSLGRATDTALPPSRALVASTMGFTERGLRGAITLVLDQGTVAAVYPGVDLTSIDAACDACGELSNMLVGSLKTHLRSLGVTIQLGLPVTMAGEGIQLLAPWTGQSRWQRFDGAHGPVRLRLNVQFAPDFAFAPEAALDLSAHAGDAFLF